MLALEMSPQEEEGQRETDVRAVECHSLDSYLLLCWDKVAVTFLQSIPQNRLPQHTMHHSRWALALASTGKNVLCVRLL